MEKISNVLIIDDDEITSFLNKSVVESLHVADKILCLADEQQALEFLIERCTGKAAGEDECPELVFLDLNMPLFNAFEFLELLQKHQTISIEKLFIVLLTSSWDSRDMEKARQYHIGGFLHKPLTMEKVQEVVKNCLEQRVRISLTASQKQSPDSSENLYR